VSGPFSSVMLSAGAGLFPSPPSDVGVALVANVDLLSSMTTYSSLAPVSKFRSVVELAQTKIGTGNANITQATFDDLAVLGSSNFPVITNVLPTGIMPADLVPNGTVSTQTFFTDIVTFSAQQILGNNDLSKFCQIFMTSQGYLSQANSVLNSINDSELLATTYDPKTGGMDTLSTGGMNQITNDTQYTSSDMSRLGNLIDLANLQDLGLPGQLLAQIGKINGGELSVVTESLQAVGIPASKIQSLSQGQNVLSASEERDAYTAMLSVNGADLQQVMLLLRVRTVGITNMAQLLDPKHLFPQSFRSLQCPVVDGLQPIYLPSGDVNTNLAVTLRDTVIESYTGPNNSNSLATLEKILPADQALANKALSRSLSQIKNVIFSDLPSMSAAMAVTQPISDLNQVTALSQPVPDSVKNVYRQDLAQGTGPADTILLTDMIGVPSGLTLIDDFRTVIQQLVEIDPDAVTLGVCYNNMLAVLNGFFGDDPVIIPSGPGSGTYSNVDQAFNMGLLPAANNEISNIVSTRNQQTNAANTAWNNMITDLSRERSNQITADINLSELAPNNRQAVMSFTTNLHDYGQDVADNGAGQYLRSVVNMQSLSGQSLLASLREGRNIQALQEAGLQLDCQLADS
jgi:hypothetical protein